MTEATEEMIIEEVLNCGLDSDHDNPRYIPVVIYDNGVINAFSPRPSVEDAWAAAHRIWHHFSSSAKPYKIGFEIVRVFHGGARIIPPGESS